MTTMLQSGLDISPVITHRFPFTAYEEAFQLMKSGQSGKIVLDWIDRAEQNELRIQNT
jgi:threonine 3-dehydrogenase